MSGALRNLVVTCPVVFGGLLMVGCSGGDQPSGPSGAAGTRTESSSADAAGLGVGGSTGTPGSPGASGAPGSACGELTPKEARSLVVDRLIALQNAVLDAWPAVENSRVMPQILAGKGEKFGRAQDARDDVERERDDLNKYWLPDSSVETAQAAEVVFRLDPATYCSRILDKCADDPSNYAGTGTGLVAASPDAGASGGTKTCTQSWRLEDHDDCVRDLTDHEIRFKVTRIACDSGTQVRLSVLVGQERLVPGSIDLYADRALSTIDFGPIAEIVTLFSEPSDHVVIASGATGQIKAELGFGTPGQIRWRMDVTQAIDFSWTSNGTPSGFAFAAGERVVELGLDANTHAATAHLGLGPGRFTTSLDSFVHSLFAANVIDSVHKQDPTQFELSGLTGDFIYDGARDVLSATGLGLGASSSRLVHAGDTLLTIDVDAEGDRKVNVDFSRSTTDHVIATLRPGFDLALGYKMNKVSGYCTNLDTFVSDDTLTIHFADPEAANAEFILDSDSNVSLPGSRIGAILSVLSGQLDIASRIAPTESVSVRAGQCLLRDPDRKSGSHEVLRTLFAGACP